MEKNNNNFILKRIQNFLYSFYAKETDDARLSEIYDGLVKALMQDIGKNWTKSKKFFKNNHHLAVTCIICIVRSGVFILNKTACLKLFM